MLQLPFTNSKPTFQISSLLFDPFRFSQPVRYAEERHHCQKEQILTILTARSRPRKARNRHLRPSSSPTELPQGPAKTDQRTRKEVLGSSRPLPRCPPHSPPTKAIEPITNIANTEETTIPNPYRCPRCHLGRRCIPSRDCWKATTNQGGRKQGVEGCPGREGARWC